MVKTSHTHKTKEFKIILKTKHDRTNTRLIPALIKEDKFLSPIVLKGDYACLRRLIKARESLIKRSRGIQNKIKGIIAEYFPETRLELRELIEAYELWDRQKKDLESPIRKITQRLPKTKYLIELAGIRYSTIARLLSETGRLKDYTNSKEIEKLVGLNLVENSSGKHTSTQTISKRGRKLFKK